MRKNENQDEVVEDLLCQTTSLAPVYSSSEIKSLKIRVKNHPNLGLFQILGEDIEIETILGSSPKRPIPVTIGVWPGTRWFCP